MSTRSRSTLPALLLTVFTFSAGSVVPARAAIVALPASTPPLQIAAADAAASRPVLLHAPLASPDPLHRHAARPAASPHCSAGSACAATVSPADDAPAGASRADEGRYDFYWRVSVAADVSTAAPVASSGTTDVRGALAWRQPRDAASADHDDASVGLFALPVAVSGSAAEGARGSWLFVDTRDSAVQHDGGTAFVLVADREGRPGETRVGDASARLPDVDDPVDALPEPPAWALLGAGLPLLAFVAWRRRKRRR